MQKCIDPNQPCQPVLAGKQVMTIARWIALFLTLSVLPVFVSANSARAGIFERAGFSFSDELGGFVILGVSGNGSHTNPFVIDEEITQTGPAVLIIRRTFSGGETRGWHQNARRERIHIVKSIINKTAKVWSGFQLELRQHPDWPSSLEDGLSFDQIWQQKDDVSSTRFERKQRLFEPADRIKFDQGHVNPGELLKLAVPVTDPTPTSEFYLIQLPEFLVAER